jgi:integrase
VRRTTTTPVRNIKADRPWTVAQVFTTSYGTLYEPRNFARHFALRCSKAGVRYIWVHDTRRTCASLLVALNVHPRVATQVYSEVPSEATQDALKRLGQGLDCPSATLHLLLHKDD